MMNGPSWGSVLATPLKIVPSKIPLFMQIMIFNRKVSNPPPPPKKSENPQEALVDEELVSQSDAFSNQDATKLYDYIYKDDRP